MHCIYADPNSSRIKAVRNIAFLIFCLQLAKDSYVTWCVYNDFLMNSDEFKLIFSYDTESEEDFTFNSFSDQDLIMDDTSSSSKKHSKTKRMRTTTPSVQENVDATPQQEHCVRPYENQPKSKQKSLEEDWPNGLNPGTSSNSQDVCQIVHVGHDTGEAEMNQLSRFQHLEMVKLIAMHVGIGQNSDPVCSDADDGSNPDWSPDDGQDQDDVAGDTPEPPLPQERRKTHDPLCSENEDGVAERSGIFLRPLGTKLATFDVDDSVTEYVSSYLYSTISNDSFKAIKESTKNPNINFFEAPMLNSSAGNSLKLSENKSLMNGDKFLSKTQSFLTAAVTKNKVMKNKDQITIGELSHCMQQSIILLGSAFNSLSSFHRHWLKGSLSPEFAPLIKELDSDPKHSRFLFGDELASKIKWLSEENKFLKKISSSNNKKPFRKVTAPAHYQRKSFGPRFGSRHVVLKSKFQGK